MKISTIPFFYPWISSVISLSTVIECLMNTSEEKLVMALKCLL